MAAKVIRSAGTRRVSIPVGGWGLIDTRIPTLLLPSSLPDHLFFFYQASTQKVLVPKEKTLAERPGGN
jgi:hypothetical protein